MPPELHREEIAGTTCIVVEDHSLPVCRFVIAWRQGAGYDGAGRAGVTRAMLELMLRGTKTMSRVDWSNALEELGSGIATLAGQECVLWRGSCLSRHLERTLTLVGDALCTPAFSADETTALRDETVDELRAVRDDDDTVAEIFLRRALYGEHPFARSAHGEIPDLQRLDRDAIVDTYAQRCARDQLILVFAGDVSAQQAHSHTERLVERLPASVANPQPLATPRQSPGLRILVVDKPERTQAQMRIASMGCAGDDPRALPLWLGVVAFGGTFASPFTQEIREVRGWSYGAGAGFDRHCLYPAPVVLHSAPAIGDAVDCLAVELDLWVRLARGDLAEFADALVMARSYLENRYPFQIAAAADLLMPALRRELLGRPLGELLELKQQLAAVEPDAVTTAVSGLLASDDVCAVIAATADRIVEPLREHFGTAALEVADYRDGLDL